MRIISKFFLAVLLVGACLSGCNRGKFGGGGDNTSPSKKTSIEIKKISNSQQTSMGKGQLLVRSAYKLVLTCVNCAQLGISLVFGEPKLENKMYVHRANFNYSWVERTEVCQVKLSVKSRSGNDINSSKSYNIYNCPLQGQSLMEKCDKSNAVPACNLGR